MSKKPVLKKLALSTDEQDRAVEASIDKLSKKAPVQIQEESAPKNPGGRPRKYSDEPVKRTILVPRDLDKILRERADKDAAGNVTATVLRALQEYLG